MTLGRAHWSMTIQSPAMAASTCGQSHAAATHTGQNTLNQRSNDANEKRFCALTFSWQENSNSVHVVYCALQTKQESLFCIRTHWTKSACCLFNSHIYGFLLPSSVHRKNNSLHAVSQLNCVYQLQVYTHLNICIWLCTNLEYFSFISILIRRSQNFLSL